MGTVIANAIFDAVGVILSRLPMNTDAIKEALRKGKAL